MSRIFIVFCLLLIPTTAFSSTVLDFFKDNTNNLSIPVITYHLISDESNKWSDFCISPQKLEDDFKLLNANGYKAISISELLNIYKNPKLIDKYKNSVILTSDDGYESDFKYVFPLMQQYNIKFNFFVVGGFIDMPWYLTSSQITQMSANNLVEFGNHSNLLHSLNSDKLREMYRNSSNNNFITNDFMRANDILTRLTKKIPCSLSYPYGEYSNSIDIALKKKGFSLRFTTAGGVALPISGITNIGRINRGNSLSSIQLIKKIGSPFRWAYFFKRSVDS